MTHSFSRKSLIAFIAALLVLAVGVTAGVFMSFGSEIETGGEMNDIKSVFDSDYLVQETKRIDNDGYVGALQYTVYYDKANGDVVPGIYGTPVIAYAINTNTVRTGTDSNETIIKSMLDRGYVVVVLDYLSQENAKHPDLDNSVQNFVYKMQNGRYFPKKTSDTDTERVFPQSGTYKECFVVPSGHNVLLRQVFWEIDKHAADGSLEKIVENWNGDFKGTKAERLVKWATGEGIDSRKKVATASDGTAPVWYDAAGKVDANGLYTKVKYTVAETFTDCVNPDGSPLETNLYMHIVYPTHPEKEVPVLSVASCSGYPNTMSRNIESCSHHSGALFQGYAGAVYDYLWFPMGRDASFGYYDGNFNTSGAVTGDHMNYALHLYNDKLINTAAMRYLRYLAASDGETYAFAEDKFTVIGLSKGGWFSFVGEKVLQSELADPSLYATTDALEDAIDLKLASFTPKRILDGHNAETRYQAGNTETYEGGTYVGEWAVEGGQRQPWLTYEGKELLSGAQFTYAANGAQDEDISEGHSPFFVASHMYDDYGAAYGQGIILPNLSRTMNIPSVFFEVALPHTYAFGEDMNYGVDTYVAFFEFLNFYMKDAPAKVLYTDPRSGNGGVAVTDTVTIKFAGEVTLEQMEKYATVSIGGEAIDGTWSSAYGDTEWTFTPSAPLKGSSEYVITVSSDICGKNGVALGETYTSTFITEYDIATEAVITADASGNALFTFTAPALPEGANRFVIRFFVENEAANVAGIYTAEGVKIASVNLSGAGSYEADVTDYVYANAGKSVTLTLKAEKAENVLENKITTLTGSTVHNLATAKVVMLDKDGNETTDAANAYATAFKVVIHDNEGTYYNDVFYGNVTTAVTIGNLIGTTNMSRADYGRRFLITLKLFDTVDRTVQLKLNGMTNSGAGTMDHSQNIVNAKTKAGEWVEVTVPYTVYETDYGVRAYQKKSMGIQISPSGDSELPVYIADFTVTEYITGIDITSAEIAAKNDGGAAYKAPVSDIPFAVYNGDALVGEYATWKAAFGAVSSGYTVKLQSNYTLTDSDLYNGFGAFAQVNIDLNGYTITCANSKSSLLWMKNTSVSVPKTTVTMWNGGIVLTDTPLLSYGESSAGGSGKSFDINLNNIAFTLGDGAMLTEGISASTIANGSAATVAVKLNECSIVAGEYNRADVGLNLLPAGTGDLTVSYRVTGGSVTLETQRWVVIQNTATTSEFLAGESGTTVFYLPAPYVPADSSYLLIDGFAEFVPVTTVAGVTEYKLEKGANSTRYGIIPEAYADKEAYPFALFKNGIFVGAYANWRTATQAAQNNNSGIDNVGVQVQLLLRRDYQSEEAGWVLNSFNDILLDLGGNTFYNKEVVIDLTGNYNEAPYTSYFTVRNGKLMNVRGIAAVDFQYAAGQTEEKPFKVTFDGVEIGYASEKASNWFGNNLIVLIWNNNRNSLGVDAEVVLNDCVINLRDNMPEGKKITVFDTSDGYSRANVDVTVNGGEILVGSATNAVLSQKDANDTFMAGTGNGGSYPILKAYDGAAALTDNFTTADGENLHFTLSEDGAEVDTYTLSVNTLATPYGVISDTYADTEAYPFALFKDGAFVGAYDKFLAAMNAAKGNPGSVIFLRRDFQIVKGDASSITNLNGSITLDLNGKELSTNGAYMLDQYVGTGNMSYAGAITIKNGTLHRIGTTPMIGLNQASGTYNGSKQLTFTFEQVTIKNSNSNGMGILLDCWDNNTLQLCADLIFNDCTLDFTGSSQGNTLMKAGTSKIYSQVDIFINGGKIIADNLTKYNIYALGSGDTATFGKGADGEYTALVTPTATAPVTKTFPTASGDAYFVEFERNADTAQSTYYLRSMTTPYGTVPHATITANPKYLSAIDYPFLLFMDGEFKRVDDCYGMALSHVKDYLYGTSGEGKQAEIFLRRDYESSSATDGNSGFLSQIGGTVIFDLNGCAYTANNYLLDAYARGTSVDGATVVHPTRITVKNGSIINNFGYPIVNFNHGSNATVKVFDFVFENITFSDGKGITELFILTCWDNGSKLVDASVTFNGCTFDLRRMKKTATVLHAGTSKSNTAVDIVINGGKIITNDMNSVKLFAIGNEDSFTFGKGADGEYTLLSQPASAAAPSAVYKNAEGESLSFASKGLDGTNRLYSLRAAVSTPYGEIPAAYADPKEYPYAVFKDGKFLGAYLKWGDKDDSSVNSAFEMAKNVINGAGNANSVVYILVRDDRTITSSEQFNNFSQAGGTYVVDLDGHTLIREHVLFDAHGKATGTTVHDTSTIVKNGTILSKNGAIAVLSSAAPGGNYNRAKTFFFTFENVKFGLANGATTTTPVIVGNSGNAVGCVADITFIGCTFDFATVAPTAVTTIVSLAENSNTVDGKVVFEGCEIIAENAENVVLYSLSEDDTVCFAPDADGKYITFTLNEDASAPAYNFVTADGTKLDVVGSAGKYTLASHTHSYEAAVTAPTCTENGYTTYSCSCGDSYIADEIPAIGHIYDNDLDADCNVCGEIREVELVTSGEVSRKIFWAFEDGVLTVTGRGKIKNFSANTAPWCHLADQITKVVIGEGITYIGSSAFFGFAAIEAVELPSTLTAMGRYVFYGCSALKDITIPEAVTEIGAYAFRRSGLETIDFAIGYGWSAGDKSFNITEITAGGHRFISKSYYKLDWVRNVDAEAEELPSDYVDGGIMHTDVIWTITTLESGKLKLTIFGNGMMADYGTAGAPWYAYWEQITEIEVCEGVTSVGRCAFYGLKFVRTVTLPETLTAIGDYGFYMCRLMKEITIPEGVTSIGKDAFVKTGLSEIPAV